MAVVPLFPLSNALFPGGVLHLRVFEIRYLDMVKHCLADKQEFGVVPLLSGNEVRRPDSAEVLAGAGTLARIDTCDTPMPGLLQIRCTGTTRFALGEPTLGKYGLWSGPIVPVEVLADAPVPPELQAAADALGSFIADLQRQGLQADSMPIAPPFRLDDCGWVADRWAELLPLPAAAKQALLLQADPLARLRDIHAFLVQNGLAP
jgi:Lon protease-like protein